MRKILVLAMVIAASAAMADDKTVEFSLEVTRNAESYLDVQENGRTVAVLGKEGCIRGPFTLFNSKSELLFSLAADATFPLGCDKK